MKTLHPLVF
jgi:hypothetical protein